MKLLHLLFLAFVASFAASPAHAGHYKNFSVAIYIAARTTQQLADPEVREQQFERVWSQVKFDKVYIETYRDSVFVDENAIKDVTAFFKSKGIAVAGGITPAKGGQGGQFGTFDYEDPAHRDECKRAVELTARHFDEIILDDFFFYTTKSDADIAAKGDRSWTEYRLEKKREVAENLILKPAKAVNPRAKVTIKYPNWYEHFQGLGYDLDVEAKMFDFIYTGTETRDPEITDQLLQQYQSYLTFRYFDNIRPNGGNRGGWVDTFSTRYVDRYPEQLWNTLFAKAPEITLFSWSQMASPQKLVPGEREAWANKPTSFRWDEMAKGMTRGEPGWARAAGYSLEQVDSVIGKLGKPIGIPSYKPYQSSGEDFLHNYLGNLGIPIELMPTFPTNADLVLLTESAKHDKDIVAKMKRQLASGKDVVITSGLLRALQGKGIEEIAEIEYTGRKAAIKDFLVGYGAGNGTSLNERGDQPAIVFPELTFYTNDSWPIIRGVANAKGFPILLMNRYSKGVFYVLNIPDNFGDLYDLPRPAITAIKEFLLTSFPVRIDADDRVSLFAYDNKTFIVQSYRDDDTSVAIAVHGAHSQLRETTAKTLMPKRKAATPVQQDDLRSIFEATIPPHSYRVFVIED